MSRRLSHSLGLMAAIAMLLGTVLFGADRASAATEVVISPNTPQGWSTADTRPGGTVDYVADAESPYGEYALELTTNGTNEAKAQYMTGTPITPLGSAELSYWTKQVSGPPVAAPSYQVVACLGGYVAATNTCVGFTTLVYEPYWNGTVLPGVWQPWADVDGGSFWSSKTYTDGSCAVVNGAGGPPFYTLDGLAAVCSDAVIVGIGVNVGTYNPNYVVRTDGVQFDDTIFNFELVGPPSSKDACKNGGWQTFNSPRTFKNQGDCIQYVNTGK